METLHSQNGNAIQTGDTIQSSGTIEWRNYVEWRHYTVWRHYTARVETLYSQSRDTIQSVWKHYSQNGNTIQTGNTIQNSGTIEWRHYVEWRHYTVRVEILYSQCGNTTVRMKILYGLETLYRVAWRHYVEWRQYTVCLETLKKGFVSRPFAHLLLFHYACITILSTISGTHTHTHTHTHTLCGQNAKFCKVKTHAVNNFCLSLKGPLCGQQMKSTLQNKYQQLYYPLNTEAVSSSETLIHTNVKGHNLRIYLSENLKL